MALRPKPGDQLEVVIGDILTAHLRRKSLVPQMPPGLDPSPPAITRVFTIFKSSLVKVKIEDSHHGVAVSRAASRPSYVGQPRLTAEAVNETADTTAAAG
uniref:DUF5641 domain-containing protein n=1 Tax=Macrostomum lignano TaxID=282301 RepID=A0A1I8F6J1_9PLAT